MNFTVLFQLTFTFINSTFSKKFSILAKYVDPKQIQGTEGKFYPKIYCFSFLWVYLFLILFYNAAMLMSEELIRKKKKLLVETNTSIPQLKTFKNS